MYLIAFGIKSLSFCTLAPLSLVSSDTVPFNDAGNQSSNIFIKYKLSHTTIASIIVRAVTSLSHLNVRPGQNTLPQDAILYTPQDLSQTSCDSSNPWLWHHSMLARGLVVHGEWPPVSGRGRTEGSQCSTMCVWDS